MAAIKSLRSQIQLIAAGMGLEQFHAFAWIDAVRDGVEKKTVPRPGLMGYMWSLIAAKLIGFQFFQPLWVLADQF